MPLKQKKRDGRKWAQMKRAWWNDDHVVKELSRSDGSNLKNIQNPTVGLRLVILIFLSLDWTRPASRKKEWIPKEEIEKTQNPKK
jgi:hypothetical protein